METAADLAVMEADIAAIIAADPQSIIIRRGTTTLAAQTVRIVQSGAATGRRSDGEGVQESRGAITVVGAKTLDIQPNDRFNDRHGTLMRVVLVYPDRRVCVQADVEQAQ